ncbi:MAG: energy transducer TonB [Saprospiraceae bacterium]|nr:energy transducer TonB [Candidatus Vicinibacter affinis]
MRYLSYFLYSFCVLLCFCFSSSCLKAQSQNTDSVGYLADTLIMTNPTSGLEDTLVSKTTIYDRGGIPPVFKSCLKDPNPRECNKKILKEWKYNRINYPEAAKAQKIQGFVYAKYVVDASGNIVRPEIIQGLGGGCDEEVLKFITSLPPYAPGKRNGFAVAYELKLEVNFENLNSISVNSDFSDQNMVKENQDSVGFIIDTIYTMDSITGYEEVRIVYEDVYNKADVEPIFKSCADDPDPKECSKKLLLDSIYRIIKYPDTARAQKIQGVVYAKYIVNTQGKIVSPRITRGLGGGCDEEVLRFLAALPPYIPAKRKGKEVAFEFNLPVKFILKK